MAINNRPILTVVQNSSQFSSSFTFFSSDNMRKNALSEIRTAQSSSGDSEWQTSMSTDEENRYKERMLEKPLYTLTPFNNKDSFSHQYYLFLKNNKNIDDLAKALEREPWFVETFMKHLLKEPQEIAAPLLSELAKKLDLKQMLGEGKTFQVIQQMIPESFVPNMSAKMTITGK